MSIKNNFDLVMDYIDSNVKENTETIKKGIYDLIGYNSNTFGNCFSVLTGDTLFHYISLRKLYFAAIDLREHQSKSICDIALDYGYSEQSAFTRAMKTFCGCTPIEIRKGDATVTSVKYKVSELKNNQIPEYSPIRKCLMDYIDAGFSEYEFGIDTIYKIADLSECLEVPFLILVKACWDLKELVHQDPEYLSPATETAINLGIESSEELDKICDFYHCSYMDLDNIMVYAYRSYTSNGGN